MIPPTSIHGSTHHCGRHSSDIWCFLPPLPHMLHPMLSLSDRIESTGEAAMGLWPKRLSVEAGQEAKPHLDLAQFWTTVPWGRRSLLWR